MPVFLCSLALGQAPPPPPPPPVEEPEAAPSSAETKPTEAQKEEPVKAAAPATSEESQESQGTVSSATQMTNSPQGDADRLNGSLAASGTIRAEDDPEQIFEKWWRKYQSKASNSLSGSTGLLRVHEAGSGPLWSFRFQMLGGYMGKTEFLCRPNLPCELPENGNLVSNDSVRAGEGSFSLSVTPTSFLEVFANLRSSSTSNNAGEPQVLQVLGDISFGAKAFTSHRPDRIWSVGGEVDIALNSGSGGVGFDAAATSPSFRALSSFDFNNRTDEDKRFPLRLHTNLGFKVDNSGSIVDEFEANELNGRSIDRISRYGLGISKVNFFQIALGAEYTNPWVRPFFEFSVDIASNYLKGYECTSPNIGEACLFNQAKLGYMPSRMTLGAHGYPLKDSGLNVTAAIDIGTGAARRYIEEVKPESIYKLWFGLSYAADPLAPKDVIINEVTLPSTYTPEPRRYVLGRIIDEKTNETIEGAIVKYDELNMTGLVANEGGLFVSQDLPPGEYGWKVTADGYREGSCQVVIAETIAPTISEEPPETALLNDEASESNTELQLYPEPEFEDGIAESIDGADDAQVQFPSMPYIAGQNLMFPLECKLKELPKVATINGLLVDSTTGGTVLDARVIITDKLERSLELLVDPDGSFQFRNVPFGISRIVAHAPGFLSTVIPIKLDSREDRAIHLVMNPRPQVLSAQLSEDLTRIELSKKLQFISDTTDIAADSMIVVEEVALLLEEHQEITELEILVHTDDSGSATLNRRLSQDRAEAIKSLLLQISSGSGAIMVARGIGPDQPLGPNSSEEERKLNERVEFNIKAKDLALP